MPLFAGLAALAKGALGAFASKAGGAAIAKGLGGLALGAAGTKLGNMFAQQQYEDQFGFLRSQGLTPTEIAGGGSSGGSPGNPGATLGNNYTEMARTMIQMQYDADQREKDRQVMREQQATQLEAAQTAANASLGSTAMQVGLGRERLGFDRKAYEETTLPKAINDVITSSPEFVMRRLLLSMGQENLMTSMRAINSGIDLNDPKTITAGKVRELARFIAGSQSAVFREAMGGVILAEEARGTVGDAFQSIYGTNTPGQPRLGGGRPLRLEITP